MKLLKTALVICTSFLLIFNTGCSSASGQNNSAAPAFETTSPAVTEAETGTEDAANETTEITEAEESNEIDLSKFSTFELSSEDLHDGVWDPDISNTSAGSNRSPQLKWEAVDGAGLYYICMIDTTSGNWLHWKSISESETELPAGWAPEKEYIGPYPPQGTTHDYEIFVFAMKEPLERIKGAFNNSNPRMFEFFKTLDNDGGNIISYGHITGTFTKE